MRMGGRREGPSEGEGESGPDSEVERQLEGREALVRPLLARSLERYREARRHPERYEACITGEELAAFREGTASQELRERILDHAFFKDGCCLTRESGPRRSEEPAKGGRKRGRR